MPYATYVAATIHVRIAAARGAASEAHGLLRTCLQVFDQNSGTNYAVRKASIVIGSLMKKMGVTVDEVDVMTGASSNSTENQDLGQSATLRHYANPLGQTDDARGEAAASDNGLYNSGATFGPDQDLDAILQNFMQQEQQAVTAPAMFQGPQGHTSHIHNLMQTDMWNMDFGGYPGDQNGIGGFDDALFGFNTLDFGFYQQGT